MISASASSPSQRPQLPKSLGVSIDTKRFEYELKTPEKVISATIEVTPTKMIDKDKRKRNYLISFVLPIKEIRKPYSIISEDMIEHLLDAYILEGNMIRTHEKGVEFPVLRVQEVPSYKTPSKVYNKTLSLASSKYYDNEFIIQETLYEEIDSISFPVISEDKDGDEEDSYLDCGCDTSEGSICTNRSHISCHSSDISCYMCDKNIDASHYYESLSASESSYQTPRSFDSPDPRYYHKMRMEKFLIMGFKRYDPNYVSVFEDNWKDMTGARSILLNLSADYGLSKIKFLKRMNDNKRDAKDKKTKVDADQNFASFTHILIVTLKHVTRKNKLYLMDFIHRLRLRMFGSLAIYGHHDSFDTSKDGSSACFTASSRSNSCTHSSSSRLPSLIRNHSLASSIRRKRSTASSYGVVVSPSTSTVSSEKSSRGSDRRSSLRSSIL